MLPWPGLQIGDVKVGSEHKIALQTMTTTDTRDIDGTVDQVCSHRLDAPLDCAGSAQGASCHSSASGHGARLHERILQAVEHQMSVGDVIPC